MTGSFSYLIDQWKVANSAWRAWLKGDPTAVKSEIESTQSSLMCEELKEEILTLKAKATRANRSELHFRIALHRDARYSVASSQYCIRLAAHNRLRGHYECARTMAPVENSKLT